MADPRSTGVRVADTRRRLDEDHDAWVATAGADGPWLVPLSFLWHDGLLLMATEPGATTRNMAEQPRVRVALGEVRDVVLVDGTGELRDIAALDGAALERYRAKLASDPRTWATVLLAVRPHRVQAWREENELAGRTIMRDGRWLA